MSQPFRKGNKRPDVSETTGITPPTRIDENRNTRRAEQISHLHQEFEDLKQKIKEVENKNEKIIEKIHKAYNFKKKNAFTEGYLGGADTSPVIHFQNRYEPAAYSAAMSVDAQSSKSGHSGKPMKLQKKITDYSRQGKEYLKNERFNHSMEYGRTDHYINQDADSVKGSPQSIMGYTASGQMLPPHPSTPYQHSVGRNSRQSYDKMQKKIFQELNLEKQNLEQDLIERDNEIYHLQAQLKAIVKQTKNMFQGKLDEFVEVFIQKNMSTIQTSLKKHEMRLRNVKKMAMLMKDKHEDRKSVRLLEAGRERRSRSRSRRNSPNNHRESFGSSLSNLKDKDQSKSRSRQIEQQEKNKLQFQEIAERYEQIIRGKMQEIDKWDKKYKTKERQCYELKMRVDIITKRLNDEERKSNQGSSFSAIEPIGKKYSTESDLLDGINEGDSKQQQSILQSQIAALKARITELQIALTKKNTAVETLQQKINNLESKSKAIQLESQQNLNKAKQKMRDEQETYTKQFENLINEKANQLQKTRNQISQIEKAVMEKQCENFSLAGKIKKLEALIENKDKKIEELEILAENEKAGLGSSRISNTDMLEKSIYLGLNSDNDLDKLKDEIERLELQLENTRNENFTLKKNFQFYKSKAEEEEQRFDSTRKEMESLRIQNEQLKIDVNINNISIVEVGGNASIVDEDEIQQTVEIDSLQNKVQRLEKEKEEWYTKYVEMKNFGLENESNCIKLKTELEFLSQHKSQNEENNSTIREENEQLKKSNLELTKKIASLEEKLEYERQQNEIRLEQIEKKWLEFEEQRRLAGQQHDGDLLRESKSSVMSYNLRGKVDHIHTQNQYLTLKLKEAESEIETQRLMEKKVIEEYKLNMEENKKNLKAKQTQIQTLKDQVEDLHRKVADISLKLGGKGDKEDQKNLLMERIQELQLELKQTKQITKKMSDMQEQLFEQIKIKDEEASQLYNELKNKDQRIKELEQISEMKQLIPGPVYNSHISSSSKQRESLKSQSSLKYSSNTRMVHNSQRMHTSNVQNQLFDLELSEAGESFYEQPSQISNISQIFQRQEIPYEKMKIKRQEQVKLFEKTATYIKSLKRTMGEKDKRIKILQKKIQSLKSSQLVRRELGVEIKEDAATYDDGDTFKDYESVQLDCRRGQGGYFRRYKQLENDTKLVMEQNNMLTHQIQSMEEQLLKAEEQENSLVKIKDLYKQQIKKLIKKNEEQTKTFEQQLKKQRKRVEESEAVHNVEALKQLFIKIIQVVGAHFTEGETMSAKKKEEKRKQVEQYVKVMSNILRMDKKTKQGLLIALRK